MKILSALKIPSLSENTTDDKAIAMHTTREDLSKFRLIERFCHEDMITSVTITIEQIPCVINKMVFKSCRAYLTPLYVEYIYNNESTIAEIFHVLMGFTVNPNQPANSSIAPHSMSWPLSTPHPGQKTCHPINAAKAACKPRLVELRTLMTTLYQNKHANHRRLQAIQWIGWFDIRRLF